MPRHALGEQREPLGAGWAAIASTSSSSRVVSRAPANGRTDSTTTPRTDSAAVMSTSGGREVGMSTTRSSTAAPVAALDDVDAEDVGALRAQGRGHGPQGAGPVGQHDPQQVGHSASFVSWSDPRPSARTPHRPARPEPAGGPGESSRPTPTPASGAGHHRDRE